MLWDNKVGIITLLLFSEQQNKVGKEEPARHLTLHLGQPLSIQGPSDVTIIPPATRHIVAVGLQQRSYSCCPKVGLLCLKDLS